MTGRKLGCVETAYDTLLWKAGEAVAWERPGVGGCAVAEVEPDPSRGTEVSAALCTLT